MNTNATASIHIKPCNIAQSEEHNRRDEEYLKALNPAKIYIRKDLTYQNTTYVPPDLKGTSLQEYYDSLKAMVKVKTGRAMQEKDVEYTDKNGRTRVRKGSSPLREGVAIIMENTTMGDLKRFTNAVEKRWGIRAVQIHIHRDEGHYEDSEPKKTWKPNYHAHIVWDWMDHDTGKSHKLGEADMSEMQDMLAEMLNMQRGQKKSETGLDHLERNDFIRRKQEEDKKRIEDEKRKIESEKDIAKSELSHIESKVTEKQAEIDRLDQDIDDRNARFEVLQEEVARTLNEKYALEYSKGWKEQALIALSVNLIAADDTIKFCINAIKDYAYSCFGGHGGNHGIILYPEEAYAIKTVMTKLSEIAKTTLRATGDWLVWVASTIGKFNERELYRADKEVKDIADGRYDGQIRKYENGNGLSR